MIGASWCTEMRFHGDATTHTVRSQTFWHHLEMRLYMSGLRTTLRRIVSARNRSPVPASPVLGIPRRHYVSSELIRYSPPAPPKASRPAEEASEREWNSFTLRNKVEHLLKTKNLEAAIRLLQRVRVPQSVYSWNLVIKHLAHTGSYTDAYKIYQQVRIPRLGCSRVLCNMYAMGVDGR